MEIPLDALLDEDGNPILDEEGGFILVEPSVAVSLGGGGTLRMKRAALRAERARRLALERARRAEMAEHEWGEWQDVAPKPLPAPPKEPEPEVKVERRKQQEDRFVLAQERARRHRREYGGPDYAALLSRSFRQ